MPVNGRVDPVARALGFAGLLPQLATVGTMAVLGLGTKGSLWPLPVLALLYPALVLSFLGGMWWSIAMRRDAGQGALAALAVVPSLVAMALLLVLGLFDAPGWTLVALGSAILLTLPVDRHLVATGQAPEGWMRLRIPLSVGLGGLTILAGAIAG